MLTAGTLTDLVGPIVAARLMAEWGGHRIPRRTASRVSRESRDAAIRAALDAGRTYADVAAGFGVSVDTVWRAAKRTA